MAFEPEASIVLVGCRGAGKRSLGFIGATHLRRRLVTEDHYFEKATGLSRGQYLSKHGKDAFGRRNTEVFKHMLDANRSKCIIECGMTSLTDDAQDALRSFSKANPVIYIHRERRHILPLLEEAEADALLEADKSHRSCSNLEYFNLYDSFSYGRSDLVSGTVTPPCPQPPGPSKLLCARDDFTKFLDLVTGRGATRTWIESPFSLSAIPPEFRAYSYALRLRLSYLLDMDLEWQDFEARGDCVELIIDTWPDGLLDVIAQQVALIRRNLGVPIIYHVEENPRGERRRPLQERERADAELLELGLRLGVDYLSLDLQRGEPLVSRILRQRGRTKIIGNYWYMGLGNMSWTDDRQLENYQRAQSLGCDIVRMARFCAGDSPLESLEEFRSRIRSVVSDPKPPLVAYDFSVLGVRTPPQSRILSPVKHADAENERDHLATVCTLQGSFEQLFRNFLLDPLQFYVVGSNVSYSLSPAMHHAAYDFSCMPHTYQSHTCSTLDELNRICTSDNFGGASLTAPFKVAMMPHLKIKSHHAAVIGAVNVVLPLRGSTSFILDHANSRNKAGAASEFYGDNTDWRSIHTCLRRAISPRNYVQPSKTTGLVIGAGGMARAAIYALVQLGCRNVFIYNRTTGAADAVARHFNDWAATQRFSSSSSSSSSPSVSGGQTTTTTTTPAASSRYSSNHNSSNSSNNINNNNSDSSSPYHHQLCHVLSSLSHPWPQNYQLPTMVISCVPATSVDGSPPADFEMPMQWLGSPTGGVVVELAYEPLVTPLVAQMQRFGRDVASPSWAIVDGLDVVSEMAIEAFELMTGRMAPKRLMTEACKRAWEQQRRESSSCVSLA